MLSRFRIRPDKKLGQNFLLSDDVLDEIIAASELKKSDTVLEIGPGLGVLTHRLAREAGTVIAVEKDKNIYAVLRKMFKGEKNVKIVNEDALFFNLGTGSRLGGRDDKEGGGDKREGYKLIANIPYYITGKLLQNFLSPSYSLPHEGELEGVISKNITSPNPSSRGGGFIRPALIVLLVQKEVAQRITAGPGDMSILAVSVQYFADAEIVSLVPRQNFYPVPEVDSAVIKIKVLPKPRITVDEKKFFHLVKIGFANKRKQLHNNLMNGFPSLDGRGQGRVDYKELLESIGLNPLCRAQDLSLEDWERLYKKLDL